MGEGEGRRGRECGGGRDELSPGVTGGPPWPQGRALTPVLHAGPGPGAFDLLPGSALPRLLTRVWNYGRATERGAPLA